MSKKMSEEVVPVQESRKRSAESGEDDNIPTKRQQQHEGHDGLFADNNVEFTTEATAAATAAATTTTTTTTTTSADTATMNTTATTDATSVQNNNAVNVTNGIVANEPTATSATNALPNSLAPPAVPEPVEPPTTTVPEPATIGAVAAAARTTTTVAAATTTDTGTVASPIEAGLEPATTGTSDTAAVNPNDTTGEHGAVTITVATAAAGNNTEQGGGYHDDNNNNNNNNSNDEQGTAAAVAADNKAETEGTSLSTAPTAGINIAFPPAPVPQLVKGNFCGYMSYESNINYNIDFRHIEVLYTQKNIPEDLQDIESERWKEPTYLQKIFKQKPTGLTNKRKMCKYVYPQCLLLSTRNLHDRLLVVNWWSSLTPEMQKQHKAQFKIMFQHPTTSASLKPHVVAAQQAAAKAHAEAAAAAQAAYAAASAKGGAVIPNPFAGAATAVLHMKHTKNNKRRKQENKHDAKWKVFFDKVVEFKKQNGHCLVPKLYKPDLKLGTWVCHQRTFYNKKILTQDRIDKLNEIGFIWEANTGPSWNDMYVQLIKYKEQHGNCLVPVRTYTKDQNPSGGASWIGNKTDTLGNWVSHQRRLKKKGTLPQDRMEKLDAIGFIWSASSNRSSTNRQNAAAAAATVLKANNRAGGDDSGVTTETTTTVPNPHGHHHDGHDGHHGSVAATAAAAAAAAAASVHHTMQEEQQHHQHLHPQHQQQQQHYHPHHYQQQAPPPPHHHPASVYTLPPAAAAAANIIDNNYHHIPNTAQHTNNNNPHNATYFEAL